ncbi:MAG: hypothetical protein CO128_08600 [Ignavibacteriales bacterium CG_4_9_14_3_um_filter_30_11]|nr:MAG: hypothetical protein CO128_08600 [Ignavibacteriales bacterium CG_4_9_14_3_um_filter_30_11]
MKIKFLGRNISVKMLKDDKILTIVGQNESILKEKGSQFIAQCFSVKDDKSADKLIEDIKKKYYNASHHCYAYRLINDVFKYSDDGEPNGTAGLRILNAIDHFQLLNVLVVVIRYFGGTKLGVGPLGKVYYNSAIGVLEKSVKIEKYFYYKIFVDVDFKQISSIHHIINNSEVKILNTKYADNVTFELVVKINDVNSFKTKIIDELKGDLIINVDKNIILL